MRRALALWGITGTLLGCGAHAGRPAASSAAKAAAEPTCTQDVATQLSPWREMTWPEYYADVEARAWRRGGVVIWVEPPRVTSAAKAELAGCAR